MKQKLLLICQHFYPEMVSTGLHMTELATTINNSYDDIEIEVLCSYPSKNIFKEIEVVSSYKNVRVHHRRSLGKEHGSVLSRLLFGSSFFLNVFFYLLWNARKYKGFIITTNPPFLGLATVFIKKIFHKPYFLIVYDVYPDVAVKMGVLKEGSLTTRIWKSISLSILKNAEKFSVIGRDMERIILAKHESLQQKSVLIYNWSDGEHFKEIPMGQNIFLQQNPQLKDKTLFVYSGNMGRTHNVEDIIAFADCFTTTDDCVFVFIGGGAKFRYVQQEAGKRKNIVVLPYQPFEVLPHVLSAAGFCLVCLDTFYTGFSVPSKTYGIMAASKPLIGFLAADSEIGMTITENNCGFVIEKNEVGILAKEKIMHALLSEQYTAMCGNSRRAFENNFTLELAAEKYYKSFKDTLA